MTVVQTFADFGAKLTASSLPGDVAYHAKRAVIDWYAALLPGAVEAPARSTGHCNTVW